MHRQRADRIRNTHKDIGDPCTIVDRLRDAVDAAAGRLLEIEYRTLGESLGRPAKMRQAAAGAARRQRDISGGR